MVLLATVQVLLARSSGQKDISVGTPIANRSHSELEGLIGFFVNTLVLRSDLSGNPTFIEVLRRVRALALSAYAHQDVPFEQLVEMLQPERDLSRSPLFQVMFSFQQIQDLSQQPDGLRLSGFGVAQTVAKFDLAFHVVIGPGTMDCGVEYNTDLFAHKTIDLLLGRWQMLMDAVVVHPEQRLADLPFLLDEERQCLLYEWNTTDAASGLNMCLHEFRGSGWAQSRCSCGSF